MDPNEKMKQIKYAMNARMFILIGAIVLLMNAITTSIPNGMQYIALAKVVEEYDAGDGAEDTDEADDTAVVSEDTVEAEEAVVSEDAAEADGTEVSEGEAAAEEASNEIDVAALKKDMETLGVTADDFRMIGYGTVIISIIRILIGIACLFLANRVDKASFTFKLVITLIVAEVIYIFFMFFKHALFLGSILYTMLIVGALLWGAIRLVKLAKENPDRVLAVNTMANRARQQAAAPKKSIRERAAMTASEEEDGEGDSGDGSQ